MTPGPAPAAAAGIRDALVVNAGSTSVKLSRIVDGVEQPAPDDLDAALRGAPPALVAHRVVHGGARTAPARVDDDLVHELDQLTELAPLHQPPALHAMADCRAAWPDAQQWACFDTAFHTSMPASARTYALPQRLRERVQAYGFHGISHAWSVRAVQQQAPEARRVLVAHLGGGQSLCGALDGRSQVTTMGFTPLDGLVMSTRSGTVDPGALLWLARHTDEDLDTVLEKESGLAGLAGTGDMREVVDRAGAGDGVARFALDVWQHRFLRQAGGCIAALGGLDALVFTGGVGENSTAVRRLVADGLAWLGVTVVGDDASDTGGSVREVSARGARVRTFVVAAREDLQMLHEIAGRSGG